MLVLTPGFETEVDDVESGQTADAPSQPEGPRERKMNTPSVVLTEIKGALARHLRSLYPAMGDAQWVNIPRR